MPARKHLRLILLLLLAVLAPCIVLTILGVRMIRQERELSVRRLEDQRQILTARLRQDLLSRLERIKLQAQSAFPQGTGRSSHPAVVLVARLDDAGLVLPWEQSPSRREFLEAAGSPGFVRRIREGEQQEFSGRSPARAAATYEGALKLAEHPAQKALARLYLARALNKAGRVREASSQYRKLLSLAPTLADEQGMPFALYAAGQLEEEEAVRAVLRNVLEQPAWLEPIAYYRVAELLVASASDSADLKREAEARIDDIEQAQALRSAHPALAAFEQTPDGEPVWIRFGEPAWLISAAPPLGNLPGVLVAVRAEAALGTMPVAAVRLTTEKQPDSWPVGESFPGVFAGPRDSAPIGWSGRQSFYLAALLLVLSTTLLATWLVWRDLRRELHMTELRAQFVSSVSHELKTPLTAIRMFAETLRMRHWKDGRTQQEYLDTIVNESERLARLVDNVLDFSRIERGKKTYDLKPASLADAVRAAARAVQYPMSQQGFRLNAEVADDVPQVRADTDAVEQAVLNLLANAMKYSGDSREIDLRLRRVDGRARIDVSDHGIGIAPDEQRRIFEKFYRVPTRQNQLIPGTGLGLTLVEHVAKAHGGGVTVESVPGRGSTFSIEIPLGDGP
jgi:signal transduction histidine kinase